MGMKKSGLASSWLTAVKNAFTTSSSKKPAAHDVNCTNEDGANGNANKSNKRRGATESQPQEQEKKRGKRRWLFSKSVANKHFEGNANMVLSAEQRHAIAVAAATAATAEAAAATAQAAIEIVRLTGNSNFFEVTLSATVVIQTAFRGFLARKALRALKGLVKLQAMVRGQNVRKQTKMTLQYIQALVRVQDQMRDHRARLSHEGGRRSSALAESNTSRDSRLHQNTYERRRTTFSGDGSGQLDNWEERSRALDEIDKMLQSKKEELMKREMALAYAFSQQIQSYGRNVSSGHESELGAEWLDRWNAWKQGESRRASADYHSEKIVELEASKHPLQHIWHMPRPLQQINHQRPASPQQVASPQRRRQEFSFKNQSPATPSTPKVIRSLQVRSAGPRYFREEKSFSTTHTPKLSSSYRLNAELLNGQERVTANDQPNYMTATESA